jgi:hypothetical protein
VAPHAEVAHELVDPVLELDVGGSARLHGGGGGQPVAAAAAKDRPRRKAGTERAQTRESVPGKGIEVLSPGLGDLRGIVQIREVQILDEP